MLPPYTTQASSSQASKHASYLLSPTLLTSHLPTQPTMNSPVFLAFLTLMSLVSMSEALFKKKKEAPPEYS